MKPIRIAVIDEQEIFRRGVVACLEEQPDVDVVVDAARGPVRASVDVAVVSLDTAAHEAFDCPLVVYADSRQPPPSLCGNRVLGAIAMADLTPARLVGATQAAASGLEISLAQEGASSLDPRSLVVLELLADGADTARIAKRLGCSPRTVKSIVRHIKSELRARSRAEAVARGIRRGLI